MIPYFLLLFFTFVVFVSHSFTNKNVNYMTGILWALVMSIFVGFQDEIGSDNSMYRLWAYMDTDGFDNLSAKLIVTIVQTFNLPDSFVFYIYTLISYLFLTLFFLQYPKESRYVGALLLFSNIYFIQSFNVIRQIAAVSVFLYGAALFIKGKKSSYFFLLIALCIHMTSLLAIAILFVSKYIKFGWPLFIVYCFSVVLFLMGGIVQYMRSAVAFLALYDSHYDYLTDNTIIAYAGLGVQFLLNVAYAMVFFFRRKAPLLVQHNQTFLLAFIGLICYNIMAADITFFRMAYYFYFFIYVTVPLFVASFNPKERVPLAWGLSFLYIVQFFSIISANGSFLPYRNVLF